MPIWPGLMIRLSGAAEGNCSPRETGGEMSGQRERRHTILHFCCDHRSLTTHARYLHRAGFRVLHSSNGFEAIKLATAEPVDAVVLDLDRNHSEVTLIAQQIKRLRPQVPTIVLAETKAPVDGIRAVADALVLKEDTPEALVTSLEKVLKLV